MTKYCRGCVFGVPGGVGAYGYDTRYALKMRLLYVVLFLSSATKFTVPSQLTSPALNSDGISSVLCREIQVALSRSDELQFTWPRQNCTY